MKKNRYDIVFLDHMMPGMDGIETLNALKEQDLIPKTTKMIVFTANAIEGSKDNYLSLGFDDYVSKPVSLEAMVGILEKYLKPDK
jgi:CheY-like chemotaxis protein